MKKNKAPAMKTGLSLGDRLIAGLESVVEALESGEPLEKRLTIRTVKLDLDPRAYGPEEVRAVRARLGASQAVLAKFLGVSVPTLQKWEQGKRAVPTIAARYLDDVQEFPDLWTRRMQLAAK
ncbi:helix-turn-helix domain-containing protein [Paludisphaera mucosa]|uniref:Helix-turn-helix domain-containing protein n=1 Tax=Paludisphaera mucosa TaxID=3030827 RepID=A0ABT6FLC9_9BACT|nr:helix-turn-helix domain-containing protein [Paludisphaera mucosa]MDG3008374.1 helix-turn-helix domain-containing protein [Paludisphaera mucosa]